MNEVEKMMSRLGMGNARPVVARNVRMDSSDFEWNLPEEVFEGAMQNMWAEYGEIIRPCSSASRVLEPCTYMGGVDDSGNPYLVRKSVVSDALYELPDGPGELALAEVEELWKSKAKYARAKQLWKRGVLLHGPHGCGKTAIVNQIIKKVTAAGGIAVMIGHPGVASRVLAMIRNFEPDRPIVCIYEEIESLIRTYDEQGFLVLLDGENQIDNVLHVATTNYIDELPDRIRARPSRFDLVLECTYPSRKARFIYIHEFMSPFSTGEDVITIDEDSVATLTDMMSYADIKEVLISTYLLELGTLEERIAYVKSLSQFKGDKT